MASGFSAFLAKERTETLRTWRIWVIPGLLLFFAATSPVVALLTPRLLTSLAGSTPGVVLQVPDPTGHDAYGQFLKNLTQIIIIAVIIAGAGTVSSERSAGTAVLVLTKPISRSAFVLAKVLANVTLLVVFTLIGTLVCLAITRALFAPVPIAPLVLAVALWLVHATLLVCVMTCFSVVFPSRGAAAGAGLAFLFLSLLLSIWPLATRYTFVGLPGAAGAALSPAAAGSSVWPVLTALAAGALMVSLAMGIFRRQEL